MVKFARVLLLGSLGLTGCAHMPADEPSDPLERVNRGVFAFNRTADKYVIRPVAKGYVTWVPAPVRRGVSNFLDNLFYPTTVINDALQAKFKQSGQDLGRFVVNTTVGIVGIFDVATPMGLPANDEDLGQTFGSWGVGEGWYLMLPIFGPSSNRDLLGRVGDIWTAPPGYVDTRTNIAIGVAKGVDTRAALLGSDKYVDEAADPYIAVRTAYLQRRQSLVYDGAPPPEKYDYGE